MTERKRQFGPSAIAAIVGVAAGIVPLSPPAWAASDAHPTSLSGNYLAGYIAQKRRDLPAAITYLNRALDQDATRPELIRRTFLFSVMDGRIEDALPLAERYVKSDKQAPIANLALAVEDIKKGDWKAVKTRMTRLDDSGLNAFTKPVTLAWAAFKLDGLDAGLKALEPLRDLGGTRALHDLHAGLMNELAGKPDEAEKLYLGVVEDEAGASLRGARILGTLYERQGKKKEAKAAFEMYLQAQPNSRFVDIDLARLAGQTDMETPTLIRDAKDGVAEALFGITSSLNRQGGSETALVIGRLALDLRPDFPVMRYMVGGMLEELDRYADANKVYGALKADTPFTQAAQLRIAQNLDELGQLDEAVAMLKKMAAERKKDSRPLVALGDIQRRHENWAAAVEAYDGAVERLGEIGRQQWQLLYTRGIALERAKMWDRAEADFLKALEYEADQPLVLNYLGYSWIEMGKNLDKALEMIKTAVAKRPHDGYITDSLGWAYFKLGRYNEAVPELERAVELRPEDPVINDHLGDGFWMVGRRLEATFQWKQALALGADDELRAVIEKKLKDGLDTPVTVIKTTPDGG